MHCIKETISLNLLHDHLFSTLYLSRREIPILYSFEILDSFGTFLWKNRVDSSSSLYENCLKLHFNEWHKILTGFLKRKYFRDGVEIIVSNFQKSLDGNSLEFDYSFELEKNL